MKRARKGRSEVILVLGGAASGKSRRALELARELAPPQAVPVPVRSRRGQTPRAGAGKGVGPRLAFVATGEALDQEMKERIARHQASRSDDWHTAEVPVDLAEWFSSYGHEYQVIVLDCLTLWLSNLQRARLSDSAVADKVLELLRVVRQSSRRVVIVSNELGLGLVPVGRAVRKFRDLAGKMNQLIAAESDEVYLVVSGQSLQLK